MKVRVIKSFYDKAQGRRLRVPGMIYQEDNLERIEQLEGDGFVVRAEPILETQAVGAPAETKAKPRVKRKTTKPAKK